MHTNTLAIPLAFIVLMAINLWITIGIKGFWWLKVSLITIALALSLFVWRALESYIGWPSKQDLPAEYQILWVMVEEPTATKEGQVFLWIRPVRSEMDLIPYDLFIYKPEISEPRAYCLNYSRKLHEQSQKAIDALKKGKIIIGKKEIAGAEGEEGSGTQNQGDSSDESAENGDGQTRGGDPYFFELPPSKFIEKDE